jgi:hypothetical protein
MSNIHLLEENLGLIFTLLADSSSLQEMMLNGHYHFYLNYFFNYLDIYETNHSQLRVLLKMVAYQEKILSFLITTSKGDKEVLLDNQKIKLGLKVFKKTLGVVISELPYFSSNEPSLLKMMFEYLEIVKEHLDNQTIGSIVTTMCSKFRVHYEASPKYTLLTRIQVEIVKFLVSYVLAMHKLDNETLSYLQGFQKLFLNPPNLLFFDVYFMTISRLLGSINLINSPAQEEPTHMLQLEAEWVQEIGFGVCIKKILSAQEVFSSQEANVQAHHHAQTVSEG